MVQLDGGRFATSDLNDLYRRIINRNNRLNKIIEIHAPDSIVNHEKRLLQEAVDALIDNKRRARPVKGSNQKELKSLSDMLKGKEGRFRKNLLGKRVDYSGRSVIVVGPHLKLHQCGLPKEMALELFKPFVMQQLVEQKMTQNIKTAKRMVDRMHPAVWDCLEKVITEHPVLLNRAPTLHRLSIQAFEPILVDGKAIQVHPLVCHAFNADFDGDQMAVHVPLSTISQSEARVLMLSTQNLFSPADGRPTVSPIQDIVLGAYALTFVDRAAKAALEEKIALYEKDPEKHPAPPIYNSIEEVLFLLESPALSERLRLNTPVRVRIRRPIFRKDSEIDKRDPITGKEYIRKETIEQQPEELVGLFEPRSRVEYEELPQEFETIVATMTPGQMMFNEILPYPLKHSDHFLTVELGKKAIADTIVRAQRAVGLAATVKLLDDLKDLGFRWATKFGISIAITDMDPPQRREEILQEADRRSARVAQQFRRGMVTFNEMQAQLIKLWTETYDEIGRELTTGLKQMNPLSIITVSGARGSVKQLAQLSGMRGLMFNQFNEVIHELPVKSSFHKGLSMLEYFVTTHGARKGLADTALRTADAGYLTRRLVDVAQDVMIRAEDCGTLEGIEVHRLVVDGETIEQIGDRMTGRISLGTLIDPATGQPIVEPGAMVSKETAKRVTEIETEAFERLEATETDEERQKIQKELMEIGFTFSDHGLPQLKIRSPLTCELVHGICAKCYGLDLSTNKMVEPGVAVGIIAAQSIGEPGTQLTMRTFHTGGVAGSAVIAKTNQYKTAKFMKQFKTDFEQSIRKEQNEENYDMKDFDPTKLLQSQEAVIKELFNRDFLTIEEEVKATSGKAKTERQLKKDEKLQLKSETESRKLWQRSQKTFFYTWTGESSGIVRVEEIFEARRQPRGKAIICPLSGVVRTIQESQFGRWVIVDGVVRTDIKAAAKEAYIADEQDFAAWDATERGDALRRLVGQKLTAQHAKILLTAGIEEVRVYWPILVPPMGNLPVQKGTQVIKGDPLTNGPLDPHDVLELAGAAAVYDYFIENLQSVYKAQGVDINDKHIEVIIRQMLRKRRIIEPGDTSFLPGQVVDRFTFAKEQNRIRQLISEGRMIKYTDPITNEIVEREMKEPTSEWLLLGISEASLANDSFLSAASFQKQVKMLTDAAVRGKQDHLVGLKENVIVGRLIPAGTGVKEFRNVEVQLPAGQQGPQPTLASMAAGEEAIVMGGSVSTLTLEAMAGLDEGDLDE
jgi:DNA-directed RNA polymerase subunit beta'